MREDVHLTDSRLNVPGRPASQNKGKWADYVLNVLIDQARVNDFKSFGGAMSKISNLPIDHSYEIYLNLNQAITGPEEHQKIFREFSPGFFDLIVVDECHRGTAAEDSAWREILEYFSSATQIGLKATPRETIYASKVYYFGEQVYSYSLKQGIQDGFLAFYKVVRVYIDRVVGGYRYEPGRHVRFGRELLRHVGVRSQRSDRVVPDASRIGEPESKNTLRGALSTGRR